MVTYKFQEIWQASPNFIFSTKHRLCEERRPPGSQHSILQQWANPTYCFWATSAALKGPTEHHQQPQTYQEAKAGNGSWPFLAFPHVLHHN